MLPQDPPLRSSMGSCQQISTRLVNVQRIRDKMAVTLQTTFTFFWWWFFCQFHAEICFHVIKNGSDNGLAPKRRQIIIWSNDCLVSWRIYASLNLWCFDIWQSPWQHCCRDSCNIAKWQLKDQCFPRNLRNNILYWKAPCRYIVANQMQQKYNGARVAADFRHQF